MAMLTRDQILSCDDRKRELIEVPEWGGEVYVSVLSGNEKDRMESAAGAAADAGNYEGIRAKLVALTVVDETGTRLFQESDIPALGDKSCAALERVFDAAQRLNNVTDEDIEELAKNSSSDPGDATA